MNIENILSSNANVQLVINVADLREYSLSLIDEILAKKEERKPQESYITTNEVAKRLGVDLSTLWRWQKSNYLVPIRIGGRKRFRLSDIERIEGDKNSNDRG